LWLLVTLAGSVVQGSNQAASTILTSNVSATATTINVRSTTGFPEPGIIVIGSERIAYSDTTGTAFQGLLAQPLVRGADSTTAVAHSTGTASKPTVVRTVEGAMVNTTVSYNMAVVADASGVWAAPVWALALMRMLVSFLVLPISFLGSDMAILGYIWLAASAGLLISFGLALAGSRRV
jgi:hypothetical protein